MKVLVLGASGLLGHNVLRRLKADGHEAVALVRRSDAIRLPDEGYEVRLGSLLDYPTLLHAAEGCDAIINCAGTTDMSLLHFEDYLPVNKELCGMLVRLIEELDIHILVHTSTVNTIGHGAPGHPTDEDEPMHAPFTDSWYAESKLQGEQLVLAAARRMKDRHIVVVNPGFMIGPWDVKPSSGRMLLAAWHRPLMAAPKGGKSFVHVDDVAQAAVNAMTMGESGSRYIVVGGGGNMTIKELYKLQAQVGGYRQRVITLPNWLLAIAGAAGDMLRALGVRTEVSTRNVRQLMVCECYSNTRALSALKINDTPIEQAIIDFKKWRQL